MPIYLNKVFVVGRLTKDPETRSTPNGQRVTSLNLATNRVFKDKEGNKQEQAEFHNVILWARLAEIASQYLIKGQEVLIEGRLQTRSWDGKDGVKRYRTEIIGESLQLGSKPAGGNSNFKPAESSGAQKDVKQPPKEEVNEDVEEIKIEDIPF